MLDQAVCFTELRSRLSNYRYLHSKNVAKTAKKLAKMYYEDEEKAYFAGLMHDITKEFKKEEHLNLFKKYNVELDYIQKITPKLWHAISGAIFVKYELGENDDEIYNAIKYHTTGKANMSLLEKIIFVSDFVSEDRIYDGVDEIRAVLENRGLDACSWEGLKFTMTDLVNSNRYIHPDTFKAYSCTLYNMNNNITL